MKISVNGEYLIRNFAYFDKDLKWIKDVAVHKSTFTPDVYYIGGYIRFVMNKIDDTEDIPLDSDIGLTIRNIETNNTEINLRYNINSYYIDGKTIIEDGEEYVWDDSGACYIVPVKTGEEFGFEPYNTNQTVKIYLLASNSFDFVDLVGDVISASSTSSWKIVKIPEGVSYICIPRQFVNDTYQAFLIVKNVNLDVTTISKNIEDNFYFNNIYFENLYLA